jgi:hypothetical protein
MSRRTMRVARVPQRVSGSRVLQILVVLCAVSAAAPRAAHAYVDPLSGSVALQGAVAGVLAALLTIKDWWASAIRLVRAWFARAAP